MHFDARLQKKDLPTFNQRDWKELLRIYKKSFLADSRRSALLSYWESGMWNSYLVVMVGSALGGAARMWLTLWCATRFGESFPVGTLAVNVLGCFVIGSFSALTGPEGLILTSPLFRLFVMVGVLGGFTTFSSFGLQTITLMQNGEWFYALLYSVLSLTLCLAFVWLGMLAVFALMQK